MHLLPCSPHLRAGVWSGFAAAGLLVAGCTQLLGIQDGRLVEGDGETDAGVRDDGGTAADTAPPPEDPSCGASCLVVGIAVGGSHTCAWFTDRSARCWGSNSTGQLGDGTFSDRLAPNAVPGLAGVVEIVAGGTSEEPAGGHTCARLAKGEVRCWGDNAAGQVGDGSQTTRKTPVAVTLAAPAIQLSAGFNHTCAVLEGGTVACWGGNGNGQLGDGSTVPRSAPVAVRGLTNAVEVAAGNAHTCARTTDNRILCWGDNAAGKLGDGTTSQRTTPVAVVGLPAVSPVEIGTGFGHTCARFDDGTARCWGLNQDRGTLGNGTLVDSVKPVLVGGGGVLQQLSVGAGDYACALYQGSSLKCWGYNNAGRFGNNEKKAAHPTAVAVTPTSPLHAPTRVVARDAHTCARYDDGWMYCWGNNTHGQIGDGTNSGDALENGKVGRPTPRRVMGL
jgi:alpha-tubulin suppressor-like RCC1 family protein